MAEKHVEFKSLVLKRDDKCSQCGANLPAGSRALWNQNNRTVLCSFHVGSTEQVVTSVVTENQVEQATANVDFDRGKYGASAMKEHDRRSDARRDRVIARSPRIGKLLLAIYDDPQSTKAWEKGSEGEVGIGKALDALAVKYEFIVLHDRLIPKSKANIDHIAITSAGVVVIDSKYYKGVVKVKDLGGRFDEKKKELWVGRRNCTKLISSMHHQTKVVTEIMETADISLPVLGLLAFYLADWEKYRFMRKQEEIDGVFINSKGVEPIVSRSGSFTQSEITKVAQLLAKKLVSAT